MFEMISQEINNAFEKIGEQIIKIEKNEESSDGNVYIIESNLEKYVAKIYNDKKHAKAMIMLHEQLFDADINVPRVVYSNINEKSHEHSVVIYSFIKGSQISDMLHNGKVDEEIISYLSKRIRKMHDVTCGKNEFDLPELPFETCNKRKALLHFDLTKSNIFLDENNDIAIIDFDDAKYGSAVYDISILISTFFFSKKRGIDIEGMNKFIDEYYGKDETLKRDEVPLIKTCALQWINYLLDENKISESLIDSFNTKIKLINENL